MADRIVVEKVNEVFAKITCERGIALELSNHFTFFVPGYQFSPKYKNRIWNGRINLFSLSTYQIYLGLVPYIHTFAKERNYEINIDPKICETTNINKEDIKNFIKNLKLQSHGQDIQPRDFQIEGVLHSLENHRALLLSPTASGKSLISYILARYLEGPGLIIVPTTSLVEQLYSDFEDYSTKNKWDVEANVHRIYEGHVRTSAKPIYISTWQSIYKEPKEFFDKFQWVIGDEAHFFKANSLKTIMTKLENAKIRIGMTGTLTN